MVRNDWNGLGKDILLPFSQDNPSFPLSSLSLEAWQNQVASEYKLLHTLPPRANALGRISQIHEVISPSHRKCMGKMKTYFGISPSNILPSCCIPSSFMYFPRHHIFHSWTEKQWTWPCHICWHLPLPLWKQGVKHKELRPMRCFFSKHNANHELGQHWIFKGILQTVNETSKMLKREK